MERKLTDWQRIMHPIVVLYGSDAADELYIRMLQSTDFETLHKYERWEAFSRNQFRLTDF